MLFLAHQQGHSVNVIAVTTAWTAPSMCYGAYGYTGGGRAVDGITVPAHQDFCIAVKTDFAEVRMYYFDADSSAAESSPSTIAPDDGTSGRWKSMGAFT